MELQKFWAGRGCVHTAALRHGSGGGHLPPGHVPRGPRPGSLECRLRSAVEEAHRRPVRRKPEQAPALLPVPGDHEALAPRYPGHLPREPREPSASTPRTTTYASWKTTGNRPRWAHGASAGRCGSTAWRSPSSPTSSRWAASTSPPSASRSPTASSE